MGRRTSRLSHTSSCVQFCVFFFSFNFSYSCWISHLSVTRISTCQTIEISFEKATNSEKYFMAQHIFNFFK